MAKTMISRPFPMLSRPALGVLAVSSLFAFLTAGKFVLAHPDVPELPALMQARQVFLFLF
jgi:hypothetical protein